VVEETKGMLFLRRKSMQGGKKSHVLTSLAEEKKPMDFKGGDRRGVYRDLIT